MSNLKQKIIRIIDELITLCYTMNCKDFNVDVKIQEGKELICLKAYVDSVNEETLNNIKKLLNLPRAHELEEYYWNLPGNDLSTNELTLLGIMIDSSSVNYDKESKLLQIELSRLE
ncbi:hypothetical protein GCM10008905_33300 [Clostridium malenominatum]|uniref:Ribosome-binding factor A n=1 Tax=Clostridium malenominatum TaxID=1539 RepID=A0ABN1J7R1_9CLOT